MAGARQIVDPSAFTSLPFGLWEAVQQRSPDSPHWQQGVTWIERCPDGGTTYDECLAVTGTGMPPEPPVKDDNVDQVERGATPFTIFAEFDCSPVGLTDAETVASDSLARVEQFQVEQAFWTGTVGGQTVAFPHLAADSEVTDSQSILLQPAATVCVTGADVAHALGELEDCLADCYAGQGVIHVPRVALPTLTAWQLVVERDGALFTQAGNRVVVGGGYANTGPDGSAPADGSAWMFATGSVFGYRGDVRAFSPRESIDRSANTLRMIAERTYVLGFECCLLAAHFDLGVPTSAAEVSIAEPVTVDGTVSIAEPVTVVEPVTTEGTCYTTATTANVASSATNTTIFAANTAAHGRTVFNDSTEVLFLKFGATASSTSFTVELSADAYYEFPQPLYCGQVDGIWAAANGAARTTEW